MFQAWLILAVMRHLIFFSIIQKRGTNAMIQTNMRLRICVNACKCAFLCVCQKWCWQTLSMYISLLLFLISRERMATNGSTRFAKTALRPWHSRPPAHWYRIPLRLVRVCSTASKHAGNTKNIVNEWPYWSKVAVSCLSLPFAFPMRYFQGQQRETIQSKNPNQIFGEQLAQTLGASARLRM